MNTYNLFTLMLLISSNLLTNVYPINNCKKLWDMNNRINGVEIYKMGLYACIEGPTPNLRGNTLTLDEPPKINILNDTENATRLSINKTTNSKTTTNISSATTTNIPSATTTNISSATTTKFPTSTTTLSPTSTNSIDSSNLYTTTIIDLDDIKQSTTTVSIDQITTKAPLIDYRKNASQSNVSKSSFTENLDEKTIVYKPELNILVITILSSCLGCCCCLTIYFVYKAHTKYSNHTKEPKSKEKDIEAQNEIPKHLIHVNHFKNKLIKSRMNIKNRNSWSKDNRIKPEIKSMTPKLPDPNKNTYKTKKQGLKLDTTEKKEKKINIKEVKSYKPHSSFVPGSPRRRLPTPPSKAPPPPLPQVAAQNLAAKRLDFLSNSTSPKIKRIVQKNK